MFGEMLPGTDGDTEKFTRTQVERGKKLARACPHEGFAVLCVFLFDGDKVFCLPI